ncbi:hypothetical protein [Streptomyces sp. cmx-18-6]|uniref:hypothetical protein n=1 Tax=Streptomyces sp. cmx-18-6 TaxID=2790930 RepID=UPI0039810BF7
MNQCTAVALLPPPDHVIALSIPGHRPEPGYVLCELGEDHEGGDHAAMLWDVRDRPESAVWVRWDAGRARLTRLLWCPTLDSRREACGLFAQHPSGHSWEVTDPVHEAITLALVEQHPHPYPQHTDEGGE